MIRRNFLVCIAATLIAAPVTAKDGVEATVVTRIPATADAGTELRVAWTLTQKDDRTPFNAGKVFIRLTGADGDSTESFAQRADHSDGLYEAVARIPEGGVRIVEIGVAGTMVDQHGARERSDWLFPIANQPVADEASAGH